MASIDWLADADRHHGVNWKMQPTRCDYRNVARYANDETQGPNEHDVPNSPLVGVHPTEDEGVPPKPHSSSKTRHVIARPALSF